jgi:hypothetical protein
LFDFAGPVQLAHKGHHQQKAPVPGHCLDTRLWTLPAEKVMRAASHEDGSDGKPRN